MKHKNRTSSSPAFKFPNKKGSRTGYLWETGIVGTSRLTAWNPGTRRGIRKHRSDSTLIFSAIHKKGATHWVTLTGIKAPRHFHFSGTASVQTTGCMRTEGAGLNTEVPRPAPVTWEEKLPRIAGIQVSGGFMAIRALKRCGPETPTSHVTF